MIFLCLFLVLSSIQQEYVAETERLSPRTASSQSHSNSSSSISNMGSSNLPMKEVSRNELSDRFKILIVTAIEFLIYSGRLLMTYKISSECWIQSLKELISSYSGPGIFIANLLTVHSVFMLGEGSLSSKVAWLS